MLMTPTKKHSKQSDCHHTIHSNKRNVQWGSKFSIVCVHRDINMSLNKTDFCIELHLNNSVKVGKLALLLQMVCLLHQLLFCVTSQCKTMLPSVVYRPVAG